MRFGARCILSRWWRGRAGWAFFFAALAGCGGAPGVVGVGGSFETPFAPTEMRIYPLTHLEIGTGGAGGTEVGAGAGSRIVCHLEFVDRWFDTCKAYGKVELQAYASEGIGLPGHDVESAWWEIDLTDHDLNAKWFDPVTRTYRVQVDVPSGLTPDEGKTLRLRAVYTAAG